jgi:hypothetical protein
MLGIVDYCYKTKQWNLLTENVIRFSQMPSQSQQVVMEIILYFKSMIDEMDDMNIKLKLIETLQIVRTLSYSPFFILRR